PFADVLDHEPHERWIFEVDVVARLAEPVQAAVQLDDLGHRLHERSPSEASVKRICGQPSSSTSADTSRLASARSRPAGRGPSRTQCSAFITASALPIAGAKSGSWQLSICSMAWDSTSLVMVRSSKKEPPSANR